MTENETEKEGVAILVDNNWKEKIRGHGGVVPRIVLVELKGTSVGFCVCICTNCR